MVAHAPTTRYLPPPRYTLPAHGSRSCPTHTVCYARLPHTDYTTLYRLRWYVPVPVAVGSRFVPSRQRYYRFMQFVHTFDSDPVLPLCPRALYSTLPDTFTFTFPTYRTRSLRVYAFTTTTAIHTRTVTYTCRLTFTYGVPVVIPTALPTALRWYTHMR